MQRPLSWRQKADGFGRHIGISLVHSTRSPRVVVRGVHDVVHSVSEEVYCMKSMSERPVLLFPCGWCTKDVSWCAVSQSGLRCDFIQCDFCGECFCDVVWFAVL